MPVSNLYHADMPPSTSMLVAGSAAVRLKKAGWAAMVPQKRCDWIQRIQKERDGGKSLAALKEQYKTQSQDANTFYRGTAHLFWEDFVRGSWGTYNCPSLGSTPSCPMARRLRGQTFGPGSRGIST